MPVDLRQIYDIDDQGVLQLHPNALQQLATLAEEYETETISPVDETSQVILKTLYSALSSDEIDESYADIIKRLHDQRLLGLEARLIEKKHELPNGTTEYTFDTHYKRLLRAEARFYHDTPARADHREHHRRFLTKMAAVFTARPRALRYILPIVIEQQIYDTFEALSVTDIEAVSEIIGCLVDNFNKIDQLEPAHIASSMRGLLKLYAHCEEDIQEMLKGTILRALEVVVTIKDMSGAEGMVWSFLFEQALIRPSPPVVSEEDDEEKIQALQREYQDLVDNYWTHLVAAPETHMQWSKYADLIQAATNCLLRQDSQALRFCLARMVMQPDRLAFVKLAVGLGDNIELGRLLFQFNILQVKDWSDIFILLSKSKRVNFSEMGVFAESIIQSVNSMLELYHTSEFVGQLYSWEIDSYNEAFFEYITSMPSEEQNACLSQHVHLLPRFIIAHVSRRTKVSDALSSQSEEFIRYWMRLCSESQMTEAEKLLVDWTLDAGQYAFFEYVSSLYGDEQQEFLTKNAHLLPRLAFSYMHHQADLPEELGNQCQWLIQYWSELCPGALPRTAPSIEIFPLMIYVWRFVPQGTTFISYLETRDIELRQAIYKTHAPLLSDLCAIARQHYRDKNIDKGARQAVQRIIQEWLIYARDHNIEIAITEPVQDFRFTDTLATVFDELEPGQVYEDVFAGVSAPMTFQFNRANTSGVDGGGMPERARRSPSPEF